MYARTIKPLLADDSFGSLLLTVIIGEASEFALAKGRACLAPLVGSSKPAILGLLGDEVDVPGVDHFRRACSRHPVLSLARARAARMARLTAHGRALQRAHTRQAVAPMSPLPLPPLTGQAQSGRRRSRNTRARRISPGGNPNSAPAGWSAMCSTPRKPPPRPGFRSRSSSRRRPCRTKSDAGAVLLDIRDDTQLAHAWAKLQQLGSSHADLAINRDSR